MPASHVYLWLTAGHVIDEINEIIASSETRILRSDWLDEGRVEGAESRPVTLNDLPRMSFDAGGIDMGIVVLSQYDLTHLQANGKKFFDRDMIAFDSAGLPPTMYIVGMPGQAMRLEITNKTSAGYDVQPVTYNLCVPAVPIPGYVDEFNDFWGQRNSFYMRARPTLSNQGKRIRDFHGMSGGVVLGITSNKPQSIRYKVFGIQSACDTKDTLNVRATDISVVLGAIDAACVTLGIV